MVSASATIPVGYKQTEVGVIPEDWTVVSTSEACLKIQDGTHFSPKIGGNEYLYFTSKNIKFGYLDLQNVDYISEIEHNKIYKRCDVKKNDLLLTKDGASTGNVAINSLEEEFSLLSSVAFLRFDAKKYSTPYFLQQFLSQGGQKQIEKAMAGNAITRLTLQKIKNLKFAVPPTLIEQNAISVQLSDTDMLIQTLQTLIKKKRSIKQATMDKLLTGKTRLPGFSGLWKSSTLQQITIINKGTQLNHSEVDKNGLHPHLNGGVKPSNYTNKWNMHENTIAISEGGNSCGYVQFMDVPFWCGGHCYSVISKGIDNDFLYQALKFNEIAIMSLRVGSGLPNVQKSALLEFKIIFPINNEEQKAIAEILSDMDAEIAAIEQRLEKTKAIKQSMMQQLLTGRIRLVDPSTPLEASA